MVAAVARPGFSLATKNLLPAIELNDQRAEAQGEVVAKPVIPVRVKMNSCLSSLKQNFDFMFEDLELPNLIKTTQRH